MNANKYALLLIFISNIGISLFFKNHSERVRISKRMQNCTKSFDITVSGLFEPCGSLSKNINHIHFFNVLVSSK